MIISLIGYRGCGKSTVGRRLADRLQYTFVDTDRLIEEKTDSSIAELFASQGESGFRQIEADVIAETYQQENLIVATGGGAILNPRSCQIMQDAGPVVWLQADVETILQRMHADDTNDETRPALTNLDEKTEIEMVLAFRIPIYREIASIEISTVDNSPEQIVEIILQKISEQSNRKMTSSGGERN